MARFSIIALIVAFGMTGGSVPVAFAQSNDDKMVPAEDPPKDFDGREFVDSRGCTYIRAGVNGSTTWVPRMTRSREVICGQSPTFAMAAAQPQVQTASAAEPKAEPKAVVQAQAVQTAAVASVARAPRVSSSIPLSVFQAPCGQGGPCGAYRASQSEPMIQPAAPGPLQYREARPGEVSNKDRIVPRHVYEQQRLSKVYPPYGYKEAWDDDRLNAKRTNQTLKGRAQMALIWTNTVPRKLVDATTGKVMNDKHPKLVYPFTSMAEQTAYLSTKNSARPKVVRQTQTGARVQASAVTGSRYVQIGVFGRRANADYAAQQLRNLGMPTKIGLFKQGGTEFQIVMAGPYTAHAAQAALGQLRRAGFADAYVR
ncbi:MAG: SPOR domain-containing protein [Rhodobacteraceae bacterium]|nr:SPOR domain-containing protein [Paracoccaceae bacterium]